MKTIELTGRGPNTMSLASLERVEADLASAGDEPLLITGAGRAFSAGLDLDALGQLDADGVRLLLEAMERVILRIFLHPAPTVALVNGHAVAGGCLLVQACDHRVAAGHEGLKMGMTGIAVGLRYPPFVFAVLGARVPPASLQAVLLGSALHTTAEALGRRLLDEVVAPEAAATRASEELEARARMPRAAYAATKRALRQPSVDEALARRADFDVGVAAWTAALRRPRRQPGLG